MNNSMHIASLENLSINLSEIYLNKTEKSMSTCLSTFFITWSALSNNRLYKDCVLCCPNTLLLQLSLKIFNTFNHFLWKGYIRSLCGTDSDAKLKCKSLNLWPIQLIEKLIFFTFLSIIIYCICFKRKVYNVYSMFTIF